MKQYKIIILSLAGIGDTMFSIPLIKEIKKNLPESKIDVLVMWEGSKQILENNPDIDKIYQFNMFDEGILKTLIFLKKLRNKKYDFSFNTYPQSKIHYKIVAALIGAKIRIGHIYDNFNPLNSFLLNKTIRQDYNIHAIENNLNLLKFVGEKKLKKHNYKFNLRNKDKKKAENFVEKNKLKNKNLIGIHVGSGSTKNLFLRRWPLQNYYNLIKKLLKDKNNRILLFGGSKELKENNFLINKIDDKKVILVRTDNIKETAAIIKKCRIFISVDTVLMHIAASMNVPYQIIIKTPTYNKTVEPYRKKFFLVGGELPKKIGYKYNGRGIYGRKKDILNYMKNITPENVYKVVDSIK